MYSRGDDCHYSLYCILDLVYGTGIISLDPVPDLDTSHPLLRKLVENRDVLASEVVETR